MKRKKEEDEERDTSIPCENNGEISDLEESVHVSGYLHV